MGKDNLSQDEWATLFTNGSVTATVDGKPAEFNIDASDIRLTEAQAELLVNALSEQQYDEYAATEVARRTQQSLIEEFDLEEGESFFE
jgi:hypothetical protein